MKAIIFEGTELAGKSTLSARVAEALMRRRARFTYAHFGLLPPDWDYEGDYLRILGDGGIVLDRFVDSELVYSPVVRGEAPKLSSDSEVLVRQKMRKLDALTVYCRCQEDELRARYDDRGEDHRFETVLEVQRGFDALYDVGPFSESFVRKSVSRPGVGIDLLVVDTTFPIAAGFVDKLAADFVPAWPQDKMCTRLR